MRERARLTTDEAERHARAIHVQAIGGPCELDLARSDGLSTVLRPLVAPSSA